MGTIVRSSCDEVLLTFLETVNIKSCMRACGDIVFTTTLKKVPRKRYRDAVAGAGAISEWAYYSMSM